MSSVINSRFFNQPGFEAFYDGWARVFETDSDGKYVLSPVEALARVAAVRQRVEVEEPLDPAALAALEHIACRYAREIPLQLGEAPYEL